MVVFLRSQNEVIFQCILRPHPRREQIPAAMCCFNFMLHSTPEPIYSNYALQMPQAFFCPIRLLSCPVPHEATTPFCGPRHCRVFCTSEHTSPIWRLRRSHCSRIPRVFPAGPAQSSHSSARPVKELALPNRGQPGAGSARFGPANRCFPCSTFSSHHP